MCITTDEITNILMEHMKGSMLYEQYSKLKILNQIDFINQYEYSDNRVGYINDYLKL
ncbi:hypothetical protein ACFPVV_00135 [Macrococcoides bohemicum]|uniref:hypothetical protein n=1 Tax=Macrococcoides bohemicum TaxID=1903056 RepID=UPI001472CC52|nr:hypothetical protein [Macrococcus bohemicus]